MESQNSSIMTKEMFDALLNSNNPLQIEHENGYYCKYCGCNFERLKRANQHCAKCTMGLEFRLDCLKEGIDYIYGIEKCYKCAFCKHASNVKSNIKKHINTCHSGLLTFKKSDAGSNDNADNAEPDNLTDESLESERIDNATDEQIMLPVIQFEQRDEKRHLVTNLPDVIVSQSDLENNVRSHEVNKICNQKRKQRTNSIHEYNASTLKKSKQNNNRDDHPLQKDLDGNSVSVDISKQSAVLNNSKTKNISEACFILSQIADQFCEICVQEIQAYENYIKNDNKNIIKQESVDNNERIICDSCGTCILNYHYSCDNKKCQFCVCIDCFTLEDNQRVNNIKCINKKVHKMTELSFTEIFMDNSLQLLSKQMHLACSMCAIKQQCKCSLGSEMEIPKIWDVAKNEEHELDDVYERVEHKWLCDGQIICLLNTLNSENIIIFNDQWSKRRPVIVSNLHENMKKELWCPHSLSQGVGRNLAYLVDCESNELVQIQMVENFWNGFNDPDKRIRKNGKSLILRLKDWPTNQDFAEILPDHFEDFEDNLPFGDYTMRSGQYNLASYLPQYRTDLDLGPKMYGGYGCDYDRNIISKTNLHIDICDALNLMVYVSEAKHEQEKVAGSEWHIFKPEDTQKIKEFLRKYLAEIGVTIKSNEDSIHDQNVFLDESLRRRLKEEYGVWCYTIFQYEGDLILLPAGSAHQVVNLVPCVKLAKDFLSPQSVKECIKLAQEFKNLSKLHDNYGDKLQLKSIIYNVVKHSTRIIMEILQQ